MPFIMAMVVAVEVADAVDCGGFGLAVAMNAC